MSLHITAAFDSGNIHVVDPSDPTDIKLEIRKDAGSDHYQWFYFRVSGANGVPLTLRITNAGGASYPVGWTDYHAAASTDRDYWFRVPTTYEDGELVIRDTPAADAVWYAYFAPYPVERHNNLIADIQNAPGVTLKVLGQTLEGQTMDCLVMGHGPKTIWVTARQHPGETMAEWWMEGFLERLVDPADPVARKLLRDASFHIVPNMNPDGSCRGHLRTNAKGVNLNREWGKSSPENSPEVHCVLQEMEKTGCDLFLDVHGDEGLPYNFIAGAEGVPGWETADQDKLDAYRGILARLSPDFQTEHGYAPDRPGGAEMTIATHYIYSRFRCLAMTLEMPFKDAANNPEPDQAWSPERCKKLGAANLDAMLEMLGRL